MKNQLNILLTQLDLLDTVFFSKDGKFDGFTSDIQKRLNDIEPDAYYIFNNQPLILFFDLTIKKNLERESEIHKKVWSFDNSPIIFIIKEKEIKVYNALNYNKNNGSLEEIELSEQERKNKFSFWELQSGFTWKWLQKEYFENSREKQHRKRVNERLFENIKEVRANLTDKQKNKTHTLSDTEANSLILRLIFIRYLIDRGIKINDKYIYGKNLNEERESFSFLIQDPKKLNKLFSLLNEKFNGVLFKEIDIHLSQRQAQFLSDVFKGEVQENNLFQTFYFEIFDFSIIPVEVISGIYESLIDEETKKLDAAVYTPSFLVEYILNDTVDEYLKNNNTSECAIFEVAVGSGIFLVQSLRKMIEREIEINGKDNKVLFSKRIRTIAENNLFGIDINIEALKVTSFSIYIALLDYQEPKDINSYKFPDLLGKNLFQANFFNKKHIFNNIIKNKKPKFILGNPPWKSKKDDLIHTNWIKNEKKTIGRYEIAQSFLLRSKDFMLADTRTALIITSTVFYNISKTTKKFRKEFLTTFCIEKYFDLSPVRRLIFEKKNSPASVVYYKLAKDENYLSNIVQHQSIKINIFLKHFKMLVLEKFDIKEVLQKHLIENDWMFKLLLYGNTLDFALLKKLNQTEKLIKDLIDNKTIFCGDGILKGTPKEKPFTFLVGLPYLDNKEVKQYFTPIDESKTLELKDTYLESGREIEKFIGEHIYLKSQTLNETEIVVSYNSKTAVNKHDVTTITSKETTFLKYLYSILISNIYTYYQFLSSSAWGVGTRPAIRLKEYLSFPFVESNKQAKKRLVELVNNFLRPMEMHYDSELRSDTLPAINNAILIQINILINNLYGVKNYEKDLIDYVLDVSRYQFKENKHHLITDFTYIDNTHYRNRNFVLKRYVEVYLNEFQNIYKDEFLQVEVYLLKHFIALNFVFLSKKPTKSIVYPKDKKNEREVLKRLANNLSVSQITNTKDPSKNLFIQKDIKGFEKDSFYIIKPNEYKSWHRAMAWYDVAEFKEAIENAELKKINSRKK